MSWFTDIAGKTENLLNKIDSGAKTILTERRLSNAKQTELEKDSTSVPSNLSSYGVGSTTNENAATSKISSSGSLNGSPKNKRNGARSKKNYSADASFIDFLNNEQTEGADARPSSQQQEPPGSLDQQNHSRQSSRSSMSSFMALSGRDTPAFSNLDIETGSFGSTSGGSGNTDSYLNVDTQSDVAISAPTSDGSNSSGNSTSSPPVIINMEGSPMTSSLDSESEMLRKELSSLNQEMTQLLKRVKEAEKELKLARNEKSDMKNQLIKAESILRELQLRETDLQESINAKDGQLAVLRVRLQEGDDKVNSLTNSIEQLKSDNKRLMEGANVSSGLHSQALTTIEDRLTEVQGILEREREQHKMAYNELTRRINQFEEEQQSMVLAVNEAQQKLKDEKGRSQKLDSQISNLKRELNISQTELNDYKSKAGRILQSKEKLILSLKEGRVEGSTENSSNNQLVMEELEQIRNERDLLHEELESAGMKIKQLQGEFSELEMISQNESRTNADALASLEQDIRLERQVKSQAEEECRHSKEELRCAHEELTKQKLNFSTRLHERDMEIQKLQKQIAHRQSSTSSQSELENRLKALTESLIHKQTTIETLGTEKQSLLIQMERLQGQYKESQEMLNSETPISFHQEEIRNRVPMFMVESPFDGGVTRRMKRAYTTLDKFSVRLGVFLRRYPIARVFVILYMFLLHIWVMIVLFTYTPEIHGPDFHHSLGTAPQNPI